MGVGRRQGRGMRLEHMASLLQGRFHEATDHAVHEDHSIPSTAGTLTADLDGNLIEARAERQGAWILRQAWQESFTFTGALCGSEWAVA